MKNDIEYTYLCIITRKKIQAKCKNGYNLQRLNPSLVSWYPIILFIIETH